MPLILYLEVIKGALPDINKGFHVLVLVEIKHSLGDTLSLLSQTKERRISPWRMYVLPPLLPTYTEHWLKYFHFLVFVPQGS